MTERLHFHFSLSCIGEGNGNPLQCSCLENPRDRGVWWAAVYGVAQSWTRLKWLSSMGFFLLDRLTILCLPSCPSILTLLCTTRKLISVNNFPSPSQLTLFPPLSLFPCLAAFLATLLYSRSSWSIMASGFTGKPFLVASLDPPQASVDSLFIKLPSVIPSEPFISYEDTDWYISKKKKKKRFWNNSSLKSLELLCSIIFIRVKYILGT